jgi:hypothetical protein
MGRSTTSRVGGRLRTLAAGDFPVETDPPPRNPFRCTRPMTLQREVASGTAPTRQDIRPHPCQQVVQPRGTTNPETSPCGSALVVTAASNEIRPVRTCVIFENEGFAGSEQRPQRELAGWMSAVKADLPQLRWFTAGLRRDPDPAVAGLTVEGPGRLLAGRVGIQSLPNRLLTGTRVAPSAILL